MSFNFKGLSSFTEHQLYVDLKKKTGLHVIANFFNFRKIAHFIIVAVRNLVHKTSLILVAAGNLEVKFFPLLYKDKDAGRIANIFSDATKFFKCRFPPKRPSLRKI